MKNNRDLEQEILRLRTQKDNDFKALKSQMEYSYKELKPSRILKRVFVDLKEEPQIKNNVLESILSLAGGYFSKRLLIGKSSTFLKSVMGYLIQIGATKIISNKILTNEKQQ